MENKDKSAFPLDSHLNKRLEEKGVDKCFGLTKREYFAAMAMQGIILRNNFRDLSDYYAKENTQEYIKRQMNDAIYIADTMLKQLSNTP